MSMCDDNILSSCQHFSMSTFHHLIWGALKKGHNTLFNFNGTSNIHNGDFNFKNRDPSVPNSSCGLIFVKIQAKYGHFFGKNMSVIQAKIGAEFKFLWFCCLLVIWSTFNAVLTFLPNSSVMRWTCTKSPKYGQNHKNTSVIRAIFHKCPYVRACPYKYGRLGHTAHLSLELALSCEQLARGQEPCEPISPAEIVENNLKFSKV